MTYSALRTDLLVAHLAAAAVVAHVLESALPGLGPWFKPGFANMFALVALFQVGWRASVGVSLIRVVVGSLVGGSFLSPAFFLSFAGAMGAVLVMGMAWRLSGGRLGPVGISLLAALAHMAAQVGMAWLLIFGHTGIFMALPWFLAGSWVTGVVNGVLAFLILQYLEKSNEHRGASTHVTGSRGGN
ncbi:MAG: Gx transporter family protein [Magnetococcales bacterium]|nr:Gx transporter family protein [Magnetococcales bacterium]